MLLSGKRRLSNKTCDMLLAGYLVLFCFVYYAVYMKISPVFSTLIDTSDIATFKNFLRYGYSFNIQDISIKNFIYTISASIFGSNYFSYAGAAYLIYLLSAVMVYVLANHNKETKAYGLLAVLIFTTFPDIFLVVFGMNIHIAESLSILLVIYFYAKSNFFEKKVYSLLYLIFGIWAFGERESVMLYLAMIIVLTTYYALSDRKYKELSYNAVLIAVLFGISLSNERPIYFTSKLGHWGYYLANLSSIDICNVLKETFRTFYLYTHTTMSMFYVVLLLVSLVAHALFFRKERTRFSYFTDAFLVFVFGSYFFAVVPENIAEVKDSFGTAYFYDIFPVYTLVALCITNFVYAIRKYKVYAIAAVVIFYLFVPFPNSYRWAVDFTRESRITDRLKEPSFAVYDEVDMLLKEYSLDFKGEFYMFVLVGPESAFPAGEGFLMPLADLAAIYGFDNYEHGFLQKGFVPAEGFTFPASDIIKVMLLFDIEDIFFKNYESVFAPLKSWDITVENQNMTLLFCQAKRD